MECLKPLLKFEGGDPLSEDDLGCDAWNAFNYTMQYNCWPVPTTAQSGQDEVYLDMINLVEGRVDPSSFDPEYLNKLRSLYRFSAVRSPAKAHHVARRIRDTLDVV